MISLEDSIAEISLADLSTQSQDTLLLEADSIIRGFCSADPEVTETNTESFDHFLVKPEKHSQTIIEESKVMKKIVHSEQFDYTEGGELLDLDLINKKKKTRSLKPNINKTDTNHLNRNETFPNLLEIYTHTHQTNPQTVTNEVKVAHKKPFDSYNETRSIAQSEQCIYIEDDELLVLDLGGKKAKTHFRSVTPNTDKTNTRTETASPSIVDVESKQHLVRKIKQLLRKTKRAALKHETTLYELRDTTWNNCEFINGRLQLKPLGQGKTKLIISSRNKRFETITMLLEKILYALEENLTYTKRGLYYQYIKLFKSQALVDKIINDISLLLNAGPWDFNVYCTSKGLIYGDVVLHLKNNVTIKCDIAGGVLIPQKVSDIIDVTTTAKFVLIIEKDTIFQELLDTNLSDKFEEQFILITGKGFPDTCTRLFVKKLNDMVSLPIYILTDSDPFGIDIMFTYRYGSLNNSHLSDQLAVPDAKWMGIFYRDIPTFGIANVQLTQNEIARTKSLQNRPYVQTNDNLKHELAELIMWKRKAEIEGLLKNDTYLSTTYLRCKINKKDFI